MPTAPSPALRIGHLRLLLLSAAALSAAPAMAATEQQPKILERVTVIGTEEVRAAIPGAATIVGAKALETHGYTDIHRALQEVPGVTVQAGWFF